MKENGKENERKLLFVKHVDVLSIIEYKPSQSSKLWHNYI